MIINRHQKFYLVFVPNKQFWKLIDILPHCLTVMNTVNTELSSVEVWPTDQIIKAFEIKGNISLTLING